MIKKSVELKKRTEELRDSHAARKHTAAAQRQLRDSELDADEKEQELQAGLYLFDLMCD